MGAVADGIGGGPSDGTVAQAGAATEVGVGRVDSGVDDVGVGSRAGSAVVDVAARASTSLVGDGSQSPRRSTRLGGQGVEAPDLVSLDGGDLRTCQVRFRADRSPLRPRGTEGTHGIVGLDLLDGGIVEGARVAVEVADVEGLLDSSEVTASEAASMHVLDPSEVGLDICCLLQSHDVLAGDGPGLRGVGDGGGVDKGQESPGDEGELLKAVHGGLRHTRQMG